MGIVLSAWPILPRFHTNFGNTSIRQLGASKALHIHGTMRLAHVHMHHARIKEFYSALPHLRNLEECCATALQCRAHRDSCMFFITLVVFLHRGIRECFNPFSNFLEPDMLV